MNIGKYIFAQVIDFIPRYQFDKFNNRAILSHQYYCLFAF